MPSVISTQNLRVTFGDLLALDGVDLDVPPGSSVAVIGPNGSGKSTLLGVLAGTIAPASGTAQVNGRTPALVLQSTDVDRSLPITVRDTVSLSRYPTLGLFRRFGAKDRRVVDEAMRRLVVDELNLIGIDRPADGRLRADVQVRYHHTAAPAEVVLDGARAEVTFDEPQLAVAPGQGAALYREDRLLGGGWIASTSD